MIEQLTLLKDLPKYSAGTIWYLRGNKIARDFREICYECWEDRSEIYDLLSYPSWIKRTPTMIFDSRPTLCSIIGKPLLTLDELCKTAKWELADDGITTTCCGVALELVSMVGSVFSVECEICGKQAVNHSWRSGDWQCDNNAYWEYIPQKTEEVLKGDLVRLYQQTKQEVSNAG